MGSGEKANGGGGEGERSEDYQTESIHDHGRELPLTYYLLNLITPPHSICYEADFRQYSDQLLSVSRESVMSSG